MSFLSFEEDFFGLIPHLLSYMQDLEPPIGTYSSFAGNKILKENFGHFQKEDFLFLCFQLKTYFHLSNFISQSLVFVYLFLHLKLLAHSNLNCLFS